MSVEEIEALAEREAREAPMVEDATINLWVNERMQSVNITPIKSEPARVSDNDCIDVEKPTEVSCKSMSKDNHEPIEKRDSSIKPIKEKDSSFELMIKKLEEIFKREDAKKRITDFTNFSVNPMFEMEDCLTHDNPLYLQDKQDIVEPIKPSPEILNSQEVLPLPSLMLEYEAMPTQLKDEDLQFSESCAENIQDASSSLQGSNVPCLNDLNFCLSPKVPTVLESPLCLNESSAEFGRIPGEEAE